jgi:hypothetical protein
VEQAFMPAVKPPEETGFTGWLKKLLPHLLCIRP